MATKGVSLRLEEKTIEELAVIAAATDRDASYLMRKAVEDFAEHEGWIITETKRRLELLESGEAKTSSHADVVDRFRVENRMTIKKPGKPGLFLLKLA